MLGLEMILYCDEEPPSKFYRIDYCNAQSTWRVVKSLQTRKHLVVRTFVEYGIQIWSLPTTEDYTGVEKFQVLTIRQVHRLRDLPYDEKFRQLGLFILQRRRLRGDLMVVFRFLYGPDRVPAAELVEL